MMRPFVWTVLVLMFGAGGALAQHHSEHQPAEKAEPQREHHESHPPEEAPADPEESESTKEAESSPSHLHHDHGKETEGPATHPGHSQMEPSQREHAGHARGAMEGDAAADTHGLERTPATAAIEPYLTSPEMERARVEARREMGGGRFLMLQGDRFEWRSGEGTPAGLFEGQGWYGGDMSRLWVKVDAEYSFDAEPGAEELESAEIQALYSRPVSAYFDLQVGLRRDLEPAPSRTLAVVGLQGLAPQWFEVDVALFLSDDGDLSSRLEAEYDMLFTQELMLQVRGELEVEGSDVPELGLGSGLSHVEAGVRLSYGRVLAPYIGVSWEEKLGKTADLARAAGEEVGSVSAVAGIRFWY